MRPFETADVVFIETLKAKHATVKAQLAAAERAQDATFAYPVAPIDVSLCAAATRTFPPTSYITTPAQ